MKNGNENSEESWFNNNKVSESITVHISGEVTKQNECLVWSNVTKKKK